MDDLVDTDDSTVDLVDTDGFTVDFDEVDEVEVDEDAGDGCCAARAEARDAVRLLMIESWFRVTEM